MGTSPREQAEFENLRNEHFIIPSDSLEVEIGPLLHHIANVSILIAA